MKSRNHVIIAAAASINLFLFIISITSIRNAAAFSFFQPPSYRTASIRSQRVILHEQSIEHNKETECMDDNDNDITSAQMQEQGQKFKVMVCGSTSCTKARRIRNMDEYYTLGGIDARSDHGVVVEESGCIGSCKKAPVVAVMHEDFMGYVGLEGMRGAEFQDQRFHKIVTEEDMDRVWCAVDSAVKEMVIDEELEDEVDMD